MRERSASEQDIHIIAAVSENHVIGMDGKIPWKIREDLQRFQDLTMDHPIVMGRRTHESIGRPLPGRDNIVISSNREYKSAGVTVVRDLENAMWLADHLAVLNEKSRYFVIGGEQVYRDSIGFAKRLYLTLVEGEFEGDTFFPDYSEFSRVVEEIPGQNEQYRYKFITLEKPE